MVRRITDLSIPIQGEMPVWPGAPQVGVLDFPLEHWAGTLLVMYAHVGTHIDAQRHHPLFKDGTTLDQIPLENLLGEAVVVTVEKEAKEKIDIADFQRFRKDIEQTRRVVVNTGWHRHWGKSDYFTEPPEMTLELAKWFVDSGVILIALDTPTPSLSQDGPLHELLLGSNISLVEYLVNLDNIQTNKVQLIILPLPLKGREGAPVRAIAIEE